MTAFGLYVHWPFCQAKCPYCDFNSHVVSHVDQERWSRALAAELRRYREETGTRVLTSIFFGGGTPSLMDPRTVASVLDAAASCWNFAPDIEITLEANPTSTEKRRFSGYQVAGVNRVSLGVQSLNDADLKRLGRLHSAEEALSAIGTARSVFDRVSFDMIYARQDQTVESWVQELKQALTLEPDHLSLYQLTIEPGTAFFDRLRQGGLRGLPDEDLGADLWDVTQEVCCDAGLPPYETSNHARTGAASRHNLIYWRNQDWVGVGPGAHGRYNVGDERIATEAILAPGKWLDEVERGRSTEIGRTSLDARTSAEETLMMGLRLTEGVDLSRLGVIASDNFTNEINHLTDSDLVAIAGGRLIATDSGRPVLNEILRRLIAG